MSKATPEPRTSGPSRPAARAAPIALGHTRLGERVLAAEVEVAVLGAGREAGDRHRLDEGERVLLQQDAVLERAGLGLVGVADEVVGPGRLGGHGGPLAPGRERRAAAADELRRGHLLDDPLPDRARARGRGPGSRRARGSRRGSSGRPGRPGRAAAGPSSPACGTDVRIAARRSGVGGPPAAAGGSPGRGPSSRATIPAASTGATANVRGVSPAIVNSAAGARSHWPRHGLRSQVDRPVAGRLRRPARASARAPRTAPRRRPAGRRCRRRRGPRPAAAGVVANSA